MQTRQHDLIVFGATGFTGRLVAEYLASRRAGPDDHPALRWALGGRSRDKLEAVRAALGRPDLPIVVADALDRAALDQVVPQARVIATTVGPFSKYGRELLAACARHGTHYCDLSGEAPFIRDMIDQHHEQAQRSGARIVPCCGFDSIPSDLGVLMMQEHMRARHGRPCSRIRLYLCENSGGISGGTIDSALSMAESASGDDNVRRMMADPYLLDPGRGSPGPDGADSTGVSWDDDLKAWTGPFVMAAINTRVVRRSNALLGYAYGRDFRYSEVTRLGTGIKGPLIGAGLVAGLGAFFALAWTRPGRAVLRKLLPKPGEGPSQKTREEGFFTVRLVGHGSDAAGVNSPPVRLMGVVKGTRDPGYGETAKMLAESALCLLDPGPTGGPGRHPGGVLTPAAALGLPLIERLRRAGMTFSVEAM